MPPQNPWYLIIKLMPVIILMFGALSAEIGMENEITTMAIIGFACVFVGAIGFARLVWDSIKR
tara:strand:- start:447 stop:635 length:189 start_codon:yes stop_codon:yes gene_type:complete